MSNGISFTCDSCGREVLGCNIVNGMKFCAKCYQETFGNQKKYFDGDKLSGYEDSHTTYIFNEKDKQIEELQKQLEEKEKIIQGLIKSQEFLERSCSYQMLLDTQKENILLKQQLKQQLHDLPKKIVGEIKTEVEKEKSDNDLAWLGFKKLNRILDTILKKYGGK